MNRLLASNRFALGSILLIWFLVRLYPVLHTAPITCTEIWEAHKLLDYGVLQRHGALMSPGHETGKLPNPQDFNYTHHPYPIYWFYTLIYFFSGANGDLAFVLIAKLAGCILTFKILDRHFERFAAWFATLLYAVAPCGILQDCDSDLVATSALLWPVGAMLLLARPSDGAAAKPASPWRGGLLAFLAGQVSWFALAMIPALMVLTEKQIGSFRVTVAGILKNRVARALLAGGVLSLFVFLLQVYLYEANFAALVGHFRLKMGNDPRALPMGDEARALSKLALFRLIPLRALLFVGLPLLLGAAVGLARWRSSRSPLVMAAIAYIPCFGLAILVIPQFFYSDNHVYGSLLFPAAVLLAVAIQQYHRLLPWLLGTLAVPGMLYIQLWFAVPAISPVARVLADFFGRHSAETEAIFTNLEPMKPPYKPSDVPGARSTRMVCDRLVFFGINQFEQLGKIPELLNNADVPELFVVDPSRPIAPELLDKLRRDSKLVATEKVLFPPAELNFAEKLRGFIWYKVMRKGKPPDDEATSAAQEHTFEIYRLK